MLPLGLLSTSCTNFPLLPLSPDNSIFLAVDDSSDSLADADEHVRCSTCEAGFLVQVVAAEAPGAKLSRLPNGDVGCKSGVG